MLSRASTSLTDKALISDLISLHKAFFKETQYANLTSIITHFNGLEQS